MQEPVSISVATQRGKTSRRLHRKRILITLKGVCQQIGSLQGSEDARLACVEVGRMLDEALAREAGSSAARRR